MKIWGSFDNNITDKMYQINPRIPLWCSTTTIAKIQFLSLSLLLPFIPIKESFLSVAQNNPEVRDLFRLESETNIQYWWIITSIFVQNLITNLIVKHLNKRGILVAYWVVNSEKQFKRALKVISSFN